MSLIHLAKTTMTLQWLNGSATLSTSMVSGTLTTTGNNGASGEFIGGTMLMSAGTASISGGVINLTQQSTGGGGTAGQAGTLSLNGGTLSVTGFSGVSGSTINFNGGTPAALATGAALSFLGTIHHQGAGGPAAIINNTGAFSPTHW